MATQQTQAVKNANARLAKTAKNFRSAVKEGRDMRTRSTKKITHSYRLFSLLKKQKGTATTEQLAAVTGLPPGYVAWYMAELKRVYGVKLQHKRGDKIWKATGLSSINVPPQGIAGRRRAAETLTASRPMAAGGKSAADVASVVAGIKSGLDTLVTVLNRSSIPESRQNR